ncbi:hypothetical protein EDEG_01740 [Edhazardia aedis USNM 41457]|uniref:Uncharacterized protein n=1 Tax=Edhazardia aedis (strain USNM 41457) TaxID=1003232 RepID=J8ZWA2_EDHAE|nr:hypothetical protein EDEG_01740 [Edhazardia aedis USNM 41457]|eukprot:EJW03973.1 hypothetical protein EDEG_01740 [Edhazardia aedis USNM 41457]
MMCYKTFPIACFYLKMLVYTFLLLSCSIRCNFDGSNDSSTVSSLNEAEEVKDEIDIKQIKEDRRNLSVFYSDISRQKDVTDQNQVHIISKTMTLKIGINQDMDFSIENENEDYLFVVMHGGKNINKQFIGKANLQEITERNDGDKSSIQTKINQNDTKKNILNLYCYESISEHPELMAETSPRPSDLIQPYPLNYAQYFYRNKIIKEEFYQDIGYSENRNLDVDSEKYVNFGYPNPLTVFEECEEILSPPKSRIEITLKFKITLFLRRIQSKLVVLNAKIKFLDLHKKRLLRRRLKTPENLLTIQNIISKLKKKLIGVNLETGRTSDAFHNGIHKIKGREHGYEFIKESTVAITFVYNSTV